MDTVEQQQAVRKYLFTVEEFHKMGEVGIFHEDDRVELMDGEVVRKSPIGWRTSTVSGASIGCSPHGPCRTATAERRCS